MINYAPINRARTFAQLAQKDMRYGNEEPYDVHNQEVGDVLRRFGYTELTNPSLHVAKHLHDVFEDTEAKPTDAMKAGLDPKGIRLAELVTDGPGKNRAERKASSFPKIASDQEALALKLSDRIANVERIGKLNMYKMEYPAFKAALYNPENMDKRLKRMWAYLDTILG